MSSTSLFETGRASDDSADSFPSSVSIAFNSNCDFRSLLVGGGAVTVSEFEGSEESRFWEMRFAALRICLAVRLSLSGRSLASAMVEEEAIREGVVSWADWRGLMVESAFAMGSLASWERKRRRVWSSDGVVIVGGGMADYVLVVCRFPVCGESEVVISRGCRLSSIIIEVAPGWF